MSTKTMVQIRSVPADLHRRLKARAAMEGLSMSDYMLREIRKALDRPMRQEILERLQARPVRKLRRVPADVIRTERNSR
jgi:plasmid stability protein